MHLSFSLSLSDDYCDAARAFRVCIYIYIYIALAV